ncbi:MAG TPA: hypothetical protein VMU77_06305, partial [Acidimicrobiales bacterium]|nr:hypothetical protein [Acidimicrobiales bacterium]
LPLGSTVTTIPGDIAVIDTLSRVVTSRVPVGIAPLFVAISPDGNQLAVGNYGSDSMTLIDTTTSVAQTYPVSQGAFGVAFSPDNKQVYVSAGHSPLIDRAPGSEKLTNDSHNALSILDIASGEVTKSIPVDDDPTGVAVDRNGTIYVAQGSFPSVARLDPVTFQVSSIGIPALAKPLDTKAALSNTKADPSKRKAAR